jgi:hypothetical protein
MPKICTNIVQYNVLCCAESTSYSYSVAIILTANARKVFIFYLYKEIGLG